MQYVQRKAIMVIGTIGLVVGLASTQSLLAVLYKTIESKLTMNYGILKAKDLFGAPLQLVWEEVDVTTHRLNEILANNSPLFAQTYVTMELQFASQHPEAVTTEMFLKPFESFFKDGVEAVNWKQLEKALYAQLVQFFSTTDFAKYLAPGERQWFVTAKDTNTGQALGTVQFLVLPEFQAGIVKVAMFGIDSSATERGIDKLLLSSIFKLLPGVSRIFLHTRITNESMLNGLSEWGFVPFAGPLAYWRDMEYLTVSSDQLQKVAENIQEQYFAK